MTLGAQAVFVGSGIFKSGDSVRRGRAIVDAVAFYNDPKKLAEISEDLGNTMDSLDVRTMAEADKMASRGW